MYKVVAIGGQEFCTGFSLAGIETQVVTESTIPEVLAGVLARDDLALVILDESWSETWQQARPPALKARLPIIFQGHANAHKIPPLNIWRAASQREVAG